MLAVPLELAVLAEWCPCFPPLSPTSADWELVTRYHPAGIVSLVKTLGLEVATVHTSRDVALLVSHPDPVYRAQGRTELENARYLTRALGSGRMVVHAWDTYATTLEAGSLARALLEAGARPGELSIENLPLSAPARQADVVLELWLPWEESRASPWI
ncbi:MAG: hypothetical protein AB1445_07990 [Bacillota bacterium]